MKRYKWCYLAFLMLFTGVSCVTQRKCLQKFPPSITKDSVYTEKVTMIPVFLPGDTLDIEVPVPCPDQDVAQVENSRLKQVIKILNGKLISSTELKPDTIKVPFKEVVIKIREVKVPEPVKYIPKIYKDAMAICIIIFSLAFLWLGWKAYKMFK